MRRGIVIAIVVVSLAGPAARGDSLIVGPEGRGAVLRGQTLSDAASGKALADGVGSAAFTGDGVLWVVAGRRLGWIEKGKLATRVDLPADGCRLAAGAGRLVIACPHGGEDDLFVMEPEAGFRYLFTTDAIDAFAVTRAGILIDSQGAVLHYRAGESSVIEPVAGHAGTAAAVCVDEGAPVLFLLVDGRAIALVGERSVPLAEGMAGMACSGGDLYLLGADGATHVLPGAGKALSDA